MTGKPGRPRKADLPAKWVAPDRPKPLPPEPVHVQTIELPKDPNEYQGPRTVEAIKDRQILTLEDAIEFLSDLTNVVKHSEDDAVQKKAFTLVTIVNTSIKAIKEKINQSPEGQLSQLNKLNALAKIAKGLPANVAKQILLDKNFSLIETIDLASLKDANAPKLQEGNTGSGRNLRASVGEVVGGYYPKESRDTSEQEEGAPEVVDRRTDKQRFRDDERARLEKERLETEVRIRADRLARANQARTVVAGRRRDSEILQRFIDQSDNEPSYDADGNAVDDRGRTDSINRHTEVTERVIPRTVSPTASPDEIREADLSWLE